MDRQQKLRISDEALALKRLNYLRGLFAILIVLGHCSMYFEEEILPLFIIHKFNMVAVCFFFIVSGWSLSFNWYNKKAYLKRFIVNKPLKLFIFAIVCEIFSGVFHCVILNVGIIDKLSKVFYSINWYVYEMILFYFAYYTIYRIKCKKVVRVSVIWGFSFFISLIFLYLSNNYGFTHAWHYSSLCFAFGITIKECYSFFKKFVMRRFAFSGIFLIFGLLSCLCLKMASGSFWGGLIMHNAIGIFVMSVLVIWAHYLDYTKIPIISVLTKYSTEIYLYQFMVLDIVYNLFIRKGYKINLVYVIIVVVFTIVLSVGAHYINRLISKGLFTCFSKE